MATHSKPHRTRTLPPTTALSQQVGGHAGVQVSEDESLLFKPALPREIAFYERIARGGIEDASMGLDRLRRWVPEFYGLLSLVGRVPLPNVEESGTAPVIIPPEGLENGLTTNHLDGNKGTASSDTPKQTLVLQNLLHGYRKPCILDVKLGTVLYDEDAPEEKRARMIQKAASTTSLTTGIRLTGSQVYSNHSPDPIVYGKAYGYSLRPEQLSEGIEAFFPCSIAVSSTSGYPGVSNLNIGLPADILHTLLANIYESLTNLHEALSDVELRIVGGSVLIIYEGDWARAASAFGCGGGPHGGESKEDENEENDEIEVEVDEQGEIIMDSVPDEISDVSQAEPKPRLYTVALIDFAHTRIVPRQGPDQGVLMGIDSLRELIYGRKQEVAALIVPGGGTR